MSRRPGLHTLLRLRGLRERQALLEAAAATRTAQAADAEAARRQAEYVARGSLAAGGPELLLAGQLGELALHERVEQAHEHAAAAEAERDAANARRSAAATERRRLELLLERLEERAEQERRRRAQAVADEQAVLGWRPS